VGLGDSPLPIVYVFGLTSGFAELNQTLVDISTATLAKLSDVFDSINLTNDKLDNTNELLGSIKSYSSQIRDLVNNIDTNTYSILVNTNNIKGNTDTISAKLDDLEVSVSNSVVVRNSLEFPALNVIVEV